MDKTLLFARINSDGSIIHLGDKLSQLFKASRLTEGIKFSEILSTNKSEQKTIDGILSTNSKSGWQGEVKTTKKNNENVWLEMYIIPFRGMHKKKEFPIISSDITKRKKAQLGVECLTNERYEEKMNHQKIITSKIIENQEKEQNKIAKDIHDGIGQMRTGLKFNLERINTEETAAKINYLKELTANIIKGVRTQLLHLPFIPFPYYEGMNRIGSDMYWLGLYRRNDRY